MKKLTALLLALALGLSLTACGGTTDTPDKETDSKTDTAQTDQSAQTGADDKDKTEDKQEAASKDDTATQEPQAPAQSAPSQTPSQPAQSTTTTAPSQTPAASAPAVKPETNTPAPAPAPAPEPAKPTAADASKYIGSTASALQGAIGAPSSKSYSPSCMGDGEDGVWTYDGFSVYTYRENGTETVEAVQ